MLKKGGGEGQGEKEGGREGKKEKEREGFIFPSLSRLRYTESERKRKGSLPLMLYEPKLILS